MQNNLQTTTIFLTPIDAELFKQFQHHYDDFIILKNNGIFELKNGNIIIHKDANGRVREIIENKIKFKI